MSEREKLLDDDAELKEQTVSIKATSEHVAEVSKNARGTWFGLLGYLAFSVLALMAFSDEDFFRSDSKLSLPFVGVEVPPILYLWFAPPLLVAIHIYLHVHLLKLWVGIARIIKLHGSEGGANVSETIYPWLVADFAMRYGTSQHSSRNRLTILADVTTGFLVWLSVPALLMWFWTRSMPVHDPWLTGSIGVLVIIALFSSSVGYIALSEAIPFERPAILRRTEAFLRGKLAKVLLLGCALGVLFWSYERTVGSSLPKLLGANGNFVAPINLRLAELTQRPETWQEYDVWIREFELEYRKEEEIAPDVDLQPRQVVQMHRRAQNERVREITRLERPNLFGRRLNAGDFRQAYMVGINMVGANLEETVFEDAELELADLSNSTANDADFSGAKMQGAKVQNAILGGAVFDFARLNGIDLRGSDLTDSDFEDALMDGAILADAKLDKSDLRRARMSGAVLGFASARAADMGSATMIGADIRGLNLSGSNLSGADLQDANCANADFFVVAAHGTDLRCNALLQEQLEYVAISSETKLPTGMFGWSCIDKNSLTDEIAEKVEDVIDLVPTEVSSLFRINQNQFSLLVFCDPTSPDPLRRSRVKIE